MLAAAARERGGDLHARQRPCQPELEEEEEEFLNLEYTHTTQNQYQNKVIKTTGTPENWNQSYVLTLLKNFPGPQRVDPEIQIVFIYFFFSRLESSRCNFRFFNFFAVCLATAWKQTESYFL